MRYSFDKQKHLHKLEGVNLTGTTSIIEVISKPLTWWSSGMAVGKLGWLSPKKASKTERLAKARESLDMIKDIGPESFLSLLDSAYRAHSERLTETAEAGTDLHAILENFVRDQMDGKQGTYDSKILPFIQWSEKNVKSFLCSESYCYSEIMWTGGKFDVIAELVDGSLALIDFKSSKEAYFSQFVQIGGYHIQVEENGVFDEEGNLIMKLDKPITKHIIVPFGAEKVLPVVSHLIEPAKEAFKGAVTIYRSMDKLQKQ